MFYEFVSIDLSCSWCSRFCFVFSHISRLLERFLLRLTSLWPWPPSPSIISVRWIVGNLLQLETNALVHWKSELFHFKITNTKFFQQKCHYLHQLHQRRLFWECKPHKMAEDVSSNNVWSSSDHLPSDHQGNMLLATWRLLNCLLIHYVIL